MRWEVAGLRCRSYDGVFTKFSGTRIFFDRFCEICFIRAYRWSLCNNLSLYGLRIGLSPFHSSAVQWIDLWFFRVQSLIISVICGFLSKRRFVSILRSGKCFLHSVTVFFSGIGTFDQQILYLMVILLIAKDLPHDLFLISV